jgi:soluble lytic murein transglycosylase-like protein
MTLQPGAQCGQNLEHRVRFAGLVGKTAGCARAVLGAALLAAAAQPAAAQTVWVFEDAQGQLHFSDTRYHSGYERMSPRALPGPSPEYSAVAGSAGDGDARWDALIRRAAHAYGLSPAMIKAVIHAESSFDPHAVSHRGARGLMQLMPVTAGEMGVSDPFNPWQNISGGTRYLQRLVRRFDGDLNLTLAAYNAGPGTVERFNGLPPYKVTRRYVKRVLELYRRYDADFR